MGSNALEEMQQLETVLLHRDFRADPAALDALLARDFQEVSPLGTISTRAEVVQWLLQKDPSQRWRFAEWQVDEAVSGVCIVRYHAVRTEPASASKGAWHVSLWRQQPGTGQWQLWFHQSTRVEISARD